MNQLRITSGIYGGRLINTPRNRGITHPMGDRERTAIFNAIQHDLPGTTILDAFAGSGALGIEALSRGATHATFLENDKKAYKTITENLKKLNLRSTQLYKTPTALNQKFDIILADPPYENPQYALIIKLLTHLKPSGLLILSHPKTLDPPTLPNLTLLSNKTYAAATIKIYQKS